MGFGQNVLIMSLFISIFLYLGGARVTNTDLLGASIYDNGTGPQLSSSFTGNIPQSTQVNQVQANSGGSGVFGLVDGLNMVFNFIKFLFNFLAAELVLLNVSGMPAAFIYLIGVPLVFMKVLAVITFIRGIYW